MKYIFKNIKLQDVKNIIIKNRVIKFIVNNG